MKALAHHVLSPGFKCCGTNLVEASAGTGKTYSLQTLFLRLVVAEGFTIQQVLVMTFTEAATKELRERLRAILERCRLVLESDQDPGAVEGDERLARILRLAAKPVEGESKDLGEQALRLIRVKRALLDFDQASIFTIHGFCQRSLQEFAFECGHDFDAELVTGSALLRELCGDWWRRVQYAKGDDPAQEAARTMFPDADGLVALMEVWTRRPGAKLRPPHDLATLEQAGIMVMEAVREVRRLARQHRADIQADLEDHRSDPFFSEERRTRVLRELDEVASEQDRKGTTWVVLIPRLGQALRPGRCPNPTVLPDPVVQCREQCAALAALADDWGINPRKATDPWSIPAGSEGRWNAALMEVLAGVKAHIRELRRVLKEDVQAHPEGFNRTDLADAVKGEAMLKALTAPATPKEQLRAIRCLGELKMKPSLSWKAGAGTKALLDAVATYEERVLALSRVLLANGMEESRQIYDHRKKEAHVMTFDDMLLRLWTVLESAPAGVARALQKALKEKYAVALVDEFQDTDPTQYQIFKTLFADGKTPFFLVGDPKQAIYSFRGGDIHTYCAAKAGVADDHRYELDVNYRSSAALVAAINHIFADRDGRSLFGRDDIRYAGTLKAGGHVPALIDAGTRDDRPLKIWDYRSAGGKVSSSYVSEEAGVVYAGVAEEIVRLLATPGTGFLEDTGAPLVPVRPGDIAVLVRRHAEAALIHSALRARGVQAVRQAGDNVFDSLEARELRAVLRAMLDPGQITCVRSALAALLLPITDGELAALVQGESSEGGVARQLGVVDFPDSLDAWLVFFREASELWKRQGFAVAFAWVLQRTGMKAWLASRPSGERGLANVIQLQDLLHLASREQHLGPEALIAWYERQLDPSQREESDAFETRLESDADAVQIMTLFKSKGLEFPIVFVPTMWTSPVGGRKTSVRLYHDPPQPGSDSGSSGLVPAVVDLNSEDPLAREAAKREVEQEDIRNLYVALTRASLRCYVVTGDLTTKGSTLELCLPEALVGAWCAREGSGMMRVERTFDTPPLTPLQYAPEGADIQLAVALPPPDIDKTKGQASFTSLAPQGSSDSSGTEHYDFDATDAGVPGEAEEHEAGLTPFSFPAGARTGECWHRIFEVLDFQSDAASLREVVDEQLALFRLDKGDIEECEAKRRVTREMVQAVLAAELKAGDHVVRLRHVSRADRLSELGFDFSLRPSGWSSLEGPRRNAVREVLEKAWVKASGDEVLFRERLKGWERTIPGGFMTGFIDLLLRQEGRYYIIDWKSNRLDGKPGSFDPQAGLGGEMATHGYFLQYLIYTVAVHLHLRQCLGRAYDYDQHFGGVFYLFIRGIGTDPQPGSQRGIYFARPPRELVEALVGALTPHSGEEAS